MEAVLLDQKKKKNCYALAKGRSRISAYDSPGKSGIYSRIAGILFLVVAGTLVIITQLPLFQDNMKWVTFRLEVPGAESVLLVGDFNHWDREGIGLKEKDGIWEVKIRLKKGIEYLYNFLINEEEWVTDPGAARTIDDGYGGRNSVIEVN